MAGATRDLIVQCDGARDDLDQLGCNDGLTGAVELQGKVANHVGRIRRRVLHRLHTSGLLRSGTLELCVVDCARELELAVAGQVLLAELLIVHLELLALKHRGKTRELHRLSDILSSVLVPVVHNRGRSVVVHVARDLLGNHGCLIEESRLLPDLSRSHDDIARVRPRQHRRRLVANESKLDLSAGRHIGKLRLDVLVDGRVHTAAETLVRTDSHVQLLRVIVAKREAGFLSENCGRVTKSADLLHPPFSFRQLSRRHHLHRLGDLLDRFDTPQPGADLLQCGHAAGSRGCRHRHPGSQLPHRRSHLARCGSEDG
mmetsp:Transcript_1862/g.4689  ORF Transcript_1862/g.4689 Transcript_1862/m.4689 type:complete len:315 (+) Transcript_1862:3-947(+)